MADFVTLLMTSRCCPSVHRAAPCTCSSGGAVVDFFMLGKMADANVKKRLIHDKTSEVPFEVTRPKVNSLSKCSNSRLPRHSTPKKVEKVQDLDSTQYLKLDINNRHFAGFEKNCSKFLLFKGADATQGLILQLEHVKRYLERDAKHLAKTRKCVMKMCESNENVRLGLNQHQEDINQMNRRLSTVTTNLTSFIEKEEAFFAKFMEKR